jgi:hypothetical protein
MKIRHELVQADWLAGDRALRLRSNISEAPARAARALIC